MSENSQPGQLQKRLGLPFAIAVVRLASLSAPASCARRARSQSLVPLTREIVLLLWLGAGGLYVMLMANCPQSEDFHSADIRRSGWALSIPVHGKGCGDSIGVCSSAWNQMWIAGESPRPALSRAQPAAGIFPRSGFVCLVCGRILMRRLIAPLSL